MRALVTSTFFSLVLCAGLAAQWSTDAATSLSIGDGTSDQTQPKVVAEPAGGVWVSWFDGIANGFDVRVQRLDDQGNEALAHNGVLVADRGFSSTQDYGLATSSNGDALLVYRDDGGTGTQISAACIAPDGTEIWGTGGVQLTNTGSFVAAPKIASDGAGGAIVAWTQDSTVRVQRITAAGTTAWANDVVFTPTTGTYSVADLIESTSLGVSGAVISIVHQTGSFGSPRQLRTQRITSAGGLAWGPSLLPVFTTGSLQFGNFPSLAPAPDGGAVFAWYDAGSSQLQCYVQHVDGGGVPNFPTNGVAVSTNTNQVRVSPKASFGPLGVIVAWREQSSNQALSGVFAQRFGASGTRLWGDDGQSVKSLTSDTTTDVQITTSGYQSIVSWKRESGFNQAVIEGYELDDQGPVGLPLDIATTVSGKSRLASARTTLGNGVLVWTDTLVDSGDIFGRSVQCNGVVGPPLSAWTDLGAGLAGVAGVPTLVGTGTICPDTEASLAVSSAAPNANAILVLGTGTLLAPFKGGVLVPTPTLLVPLPTDASGAAGLAFTWPGTTFTIYWQVWIPDTVGPSNFAATNALSSTSP